MYDGGSIVAKCLSGLSCFFGAKVTRWHSYFGLGSGSIERKADFPHPQRNDVTYVRIFCGLYALSV